MCKIDKRKVARHFSLSAQTYDDCTPVQKSMSERLLKSVSKAFSISMSGKPKRILEIGCGTGYLTQGLSTLYPDAQITAVDIAHSMVDETSQRCPGAEVIQADAEEYLANVQPNFDLIISSSTFQWFTEPYQAVMTAHSCLTESGLFALASFGQNTFHELRRSFNHAYKQLHLDQQDHVIEMIDLQKLRELHPDAYVEELEITPTYESVRSFLKSVQSAGAVNAKSYSSSLRRDVYRQMVRFYEQQFSHPKNGVTVTYHAFNILIPARRDIQ